MQKLQPLKKSPIKFGHSLGASCVPINQCPSHSLPVIFAVSFLTGLAPTWSISSLWAREVVPLAPVAGATVDWYHLRIPVSLLEVMPLSAPWAASPQVLLWWGAQQASVETGVLPCSITLAPWGHWGRGIATYIWKPCGTAISASAHKGSKTVFWVELTPFHQLIVSVWPYMSSFSKTLAYSAPLLLTQKSKRLYLI